MVSISPIGHQSQTMYPDGSCKNGVPDKGTSPFLGRHQWGRGRAQRLCPLASVPWEQVHKPLEACQTEPALQGKGPACANRPLSWKTWVYVPVYCLHSALAGRVCKNFLYNCYSPVWPRNSVSPGLQSQAIKGHPLGGSHKIQAPNVCKTCLLEDSALECGRRGAQRGLLAVERQRESVEIISTGKRKNKRKIKARELKKKIYRWCQLAGARQREIVKAVPAVLIPREDSGKLLEVHIKLDACPSGELPLQLSR